MSQKPEKATEEEKQKRKRKKKTKQTITRAVTHIRLIEANPGSLTPWITSWWRTWRSRNSM